MFEDYFNAGGDNANNSKKPKSNHVTGSIFDGIFGSTGCDPTSSLSQATEVEKTATAREIYARTNCSNNYYNALNYKRDDDPLCTEHNNEITPGSTQYHDAYGQPHSTRQGAEINSIPVRQRCQNCGGYGCSCCYGTGINPLYNQHIRSKPPVKESPGDGGVARSFLNWLAGKN